MTQDTSPLSPALISTLTQDAQVFGIAAFRTRYDDPSSPILPVFKRVDPTTIVLTTNTRYDDLFTRLQALLTQAQALSQDILKATLNTAMHVPITEPGVSSDNLEFSDLLEGLDHEVRYFQACYEAGAGSNLSPNSCAELASRLNRAVTRLRNQHHPVVHVPHRGSDVEVWLRARRNEHSWMPGTSGPPPNDRVMQRAHWEALDDLLDDYRLRADTGRSLTDDGS